MRVIDILLETLSLDKTKSNIAGKIQQLPSDEKTAKILEEIRRILKFAHAGGSSQWIKGQLEKVNDPMVDTMHEDLGRFILSMDVPEKDRDQMLKLWRQDQIVNKEALLSKSKHSFKDIFNQYGTNQAITKLVNYVMPKADLGQGKGEFGLNVLSRNITVATADTEVVDTPRDGGEVKRPSKGKKGDLLVDLDGKKWKVEVKTTDKGAARFGDQEVAPSANYTSLAADFLEFVGGTLKSDKYKKPIKINKTGLNLSEIINAYKVMDEVDQQTFAEKFNNVLNSIFGDGDPYVPAILSAITTGNEGQAKQLWSRANFAYYMGKKHDDGVLYIDLQAQYMIFYSSAEELEQQGLRFHSKTIYIGTTDVIRSVYPQMKIQPTNPGAEEAVKGFKKVKLSDFKGANPKALEKIRDILMNLARVRNIDPTIVDQIVNDEAFQTELQAHIENKEDINQLISWIENEYGFKPKIQQPVANTTSTATPTPTATSTTPVEINQALREVDDFIRILSVINR